MGKNSKKRRAQKDAAGNRSGASVPLSSFRAARALDTMTPAFIQWFDDGSPGAANAAMEYLRMMEPVLGRYLEGAATAEVTRFDPGVLSKAVTDEIMDNEELQDLNPKYAAYIADAVRSYLEFLSETGRWTGTAEQLAAALDHLDNVAVDDAGDTGIEVPDIPQEEALEAFTGLPLIQRASALLRWIGDGKPVTGTGALRLADIEQAAACVGVSAKGGTRRDAASEGIPTVRSMHEVPLLAKMWAALDAAELIEIRPTKVVPFEDAGDFLAGAPAQQLDEFKTFAMSYLDQALLRPDTGEPWEAAISALLVSLLLSAATPEPPLVERVLAAADHAPDDEKEAAALLTKVAMGRLEELAELGLLTIDTHFRVPPVLVECVADAFDNPALLAGLGITEESGQAAVTAP